MPLPSGGDPNPGLALDYNRYQSYANVSYLEEQLAMLRKVCLRQFVTTNNVGPPVDYINLRDLYRNLDFAAHADAEQTINIPRPFTDLLTGEAHNENLSLSAYGVRVLQAS